MIKVVYGMRAAVLLDINYRVWAIIKVVFVIEGLVLRICRPK